MEGKLPSYTTVVNSIGALGRGFDVTFDIRLLYCKGVHGSRLVHTDELHTRDLTFSSSLVVSDVSIDIDIDCFSPKESRETTRVCSFHEMAEHFNKMAQVCGCNSLGSFNAMFNFTGSWQADAAATKSLVMDGSFISLFKVKLVKSNLILREDVRRAVPQTWEPSSLASFIESSGTHIITSITIGGRDVVYVKQHHSSLLSPPEISNYIKEIGDQRFSDLEGQQSSGPFKSKDKVADQFNFNSQEVHTQPLGAPNPSGKETNHQ